MATTSTCGAGTPGRVTMAASDENGDRCGARCEERHGSGVIGRLSDEREERAEPQARTHTEEDGPFRRLGHAEVAAGHEPDGDRGDSESGDRERVRPVAECHAHDDGHDRSDDRAERTDEPVRSIGEPLVEQDETDEPGESGDGAPTDGASGSMHRRW